MTYVITIFLGFFVGLIAAIPVGPVNLLVVRRSLAYDPLHGFMSGLGAVLADAVYASITAFGFTAIAQLIEGHSTTLQIVGGLMLFFFGARMYLAPPELRIEDDGEGGMALPLLRAMMSTFLLAITNPATMLALYRDVCRCSWIGRAAGQLLQRSVSRRGRHSGLHVLVVYAHHDHRTVPPSHR